MRHSIYIVWLLPFLGVAALGADDLPKPKKDPSAPPGAFPDIGPRPSSAAADANAAELQRLLRDLRTQREALRNERTTTEHDTGAPSPASSNEEEIARLRKRMEDLQKRTRSRPDTTPPVLMDPPATSTSRPGGEGGAIDPAAVAENYFRAGDFEMALEAYHKVPLRGATGEERAPTLYMIATCLRKLGKRDEAAKFYREAAAIKDDPFVADRARWQLDNLTWRKEVEGQLAQLRQRRKGLETKP